MTITSIYDLVTTTCTTEQIKALLREFKDQGAEGILISGPKKDDVVKHLPTAVESRVIPESRVLSLVRDHEESGDQHIFFYKPKDELLSNVVV